MTIHEFFKTGKGFITGLGVVGGLLIGFGADINISTFWVTGTIMVIASCVLGIVEWVKFYK